MSKKFHKGGEVFNWYLHVPLAYTGIRKTGQNHKELVIIDDYHRHYVAAYKSEKSLQVGMTFTLKKECRGDKVGFIYKDKWYSMKGWVL